VNPVVSILALAWLVFSAVTAAGGQVLQGHVPAVVSRGWQPVGRLPATNRLHLAICLPLRHEDALTNLLQQIYNPASPSYRHYLPPDEFAQRFGPTESDYQAVTTFARANGLSVTGTHPNRTILDVSGTVADIERTFHVTMRVYPHPQEARTFYAPDAEPSPDLAVPVQRIGGLDNYSPPRPLFKATPLDKTPGKAPGLPLSYGGTGSGRAGTYWGSDFRAAYLPGITNDGSGQSVGLVEFDGYQAGDITYYETNGGGTNGVLPSVTLTNILLDGFSGNPTGNGGEVEVTLDIDMVIAMATHLSQVIVYETQTNYGDWYDILNRMATDNLAKQLSCSWYNPYDFTNNPVADGIFEQMAAQGQSFFQASGDAGSYVGPNGPIPFPSDDPWVTVVGGTTLTTSGPGGSWVSETVWNNQNSGENNGSSGGGISTQYPIPCWQANAGTTANQASTTMRNIPDTALTAENIYVRADGADMRLSGTSAATPLWAGLMALVNQQAEVAGRPPFGLANPAIYAIAAGPGYAACFHDVTNGNNAYNSAAQGDLMQYAATNGYDLCTGWGTPDSGLIGALLAADTTNFCLATRTRVEGPAAGSDGVLLAVSPDTAPWTAVTNLSLLPAWLHLTVAGGTGGTNVVFSFDANPGSTRTGSLTIGGQTLTITQAGSTYAPAGLVARLAAAGLSSPQGVAVDGAGNVLIADPGNDAILKYTPAGNSAATLVDASMGLSHPEGVAVDGAGNVYIADPGNHAIEEWPAGGGALVTVVSGGLNTPAGVAVDGAGDLYIADSGDNTIKELPAGGGTLVTNAYGGLNTPAGVAVDFAGNVYVADTGNNAVMELPAGGGSAVALVSSGLSGPTGVAVDGARNVYIADTGNHAIQVWTAASNTLTAVVSGGLSGPAGVAVDGAGNVYFGDTGDDAILERPGALVDPTPRSEGAVSGSDVLRVVLPATVRLDGPFTPVSDQPWLTISSVTNGVVGFHFTANSGASRLANISLLGQTIAVTQSGPNYALGTTTRLEGPAAGSDSVVLAVIPNIGPWMAATNAPWLQLAPASQSGTGSTNVIFSYDANPSATRTGTLAIAGMTVTVTQAGAGYAAATAVVPLGPVSEPVSVTVDRIGNVYASSPANNWLEQWTAAGGAFSNDQWLNQPAGLAADGAGNAYVADTGDNIVYELPLTGGMTPLVASGLSDPTQVAVDGAGNVYIAESGGGTVYEYTAASGVLTPLMDTGLNQLAGLAADAAGNLYCTDPGTNVIYEWNAASGTLGILVSPSQGLNQPAGVAVDGAGNVYVADTGNNAVYEWSAATGSLTSLAPNGPGWNHPQGVAVDGAGNVYVADTGDNQITVLPHAFVNPAPRQESLAGGSDSLPVVLPATASLSGPFAPASDQSWLTITGVTGGVVSFDFPANPNGYTQTARLTVLGQIVTVTQNGADALGASARLEGPAAGGDSVVLRASPDFSSWTAAANDDWLHLDPASQSGTGSANVIFDYDANPGATRTGTLTIAGLTVTVTQAGSTYVAADPLTTLAAAALNGPAGVAVDAFGSVYFADTDNSAIEEWTPAGNTVTTLVSAGLNQPAGVAVDARGNVYIADSGNAAIKEYTAAGGVTTLAVPGLGNPRGLAVDASNNLYIADSGNAAVYEYTAVNSNLTTLVSSGLSEPAGVAVDPAGNVYVADAGNDAIYEYTAVTSNLTTLVSSGLSEPAGVAVDAAGNVYVADSGNSAIQKYTAAGNSVATLVSGINRPSAVAVDAVGNLYIADSGGNAILEWPFAFADPTPRLEDLAAGSDTLPVVLPGTVNLAAPFAPTSDAPWLTLSGGANGVVSLAFSTNSTGSSRTARIGLLGLVIPVTQAAAAPPILTGRLLDNGAFQFSFTGSTAGTFTVLAAASLDLPLTNWTVAGTASNTGSGLFQFTTPPVTNQPQEFFRVRSP
jgi:DNA-binding beta-propeller fold protein YncE